MNPYLSIIIPCFNEEENLRRGVLDEVFDYLKKQKFSYEVIISDDGSSDKSRQLVEIFIKGKHDFIYLKNPHGGKPSAVKAGLLKARGEWVLFTDMDQATPIGELSKILPFFKEYDIVIGSRGLTRKSFPLYRKLASAAFLAIRRPFLLRKITDTQCGFKALKRKIALEIFPRLQVFLIKDKIRGWRVSAYDVEMLFIAEKAGYKIAEVPVTWEDKDITRGKKRSFVKESKEMLLEILRIKLADLRGRYEVWS